MERERNIFASFNRTLPQFSGETINEWDVVEEWYPRRNLAVPPAPLDRRPDVIALTASDRNIGIELKSWLDEQQIGDARRREQIEEALLRAIGEQGPNQTQHIDFVWLSPKDVRFDLADTDGFRLEILALVQKTDQRWMAKEHWEQECNEIVNDLRAFPNLSKILKSR